MALPETEQQKAKAAVARDKLNAEILRFERQRQVLIPVAPRSFYAASGTDPACGVLPAESAASFATADSDPARIVCANTRSGRERYLPKHASAARPGTDVALTSLDQMFEGRIDAADLRYRTIEKEQVGSALSLCACSAEHRPDSARGASRK